MFTHPSACWVFINSKQSLRKSDNRRWDGSLEGGRRMTLFWLGTVPPRMQPYNGLHSVTPTTSWCSCDRPTCANPTHQRHSGIFNPFVLQVGRCHSEGPSSNPSIPTLSKSLSSSYRGRKSSFFLSFVFSFCFGESLWFPYVTKVDSLTFLRVLFLVVSCSTLSIVYSIA